MKTADKVASILKNTFETDKIIDFDSELNIDSILFIQIIIKLEDEFQCEFPASKLLPSELNTVTKIASLIDSLHN